MAAPSFSNGSTQAFDAKAVGDYLKQAWTAAVDQANNPGAADGRDKPVHYKPAPSSQGPAASGSAWGGASSSVWANRPDPRKEQQMIDGQPFLAGLSRALDAKKRA